MTRISFFRSVRSTRTWACIAAIGVSFGIFTGAPPASAASTCPKTETNAVLFHGGTVLTMDDESKDTTDPYSALIMEDDKILAIGSDADFKDCKVKETVNLNGRTLMPGFIEPHMHLPLMIVFSAVADLSPCLPEPYYYRLYNDDNGKSLCDYKKKGAIVTGLKWTKERLDDWIAKNPKSKWVLGNGIDPSRFGNSDTEIQEALDFRNAPGKAIDTMLPEGGQRPPAFLLDQSGHLAYVNQQAFIDAKICNELPCGYKNLREGVALPQDATPPLGTWEMDKDGVFTGLLKEEGAYTPFVSAFGKDTIFEKIEQFPADIKNLKIIPEIIQTIAKSGVTTVINGGGFSVGEVKFIKNLADLGIAGKALGIPGLRYRTLMSGTITDASATDKTPFEIVTKLKNEGIADPKDTWKGKGLFAANGIKFWADGSTQGCTAFVRGEYAGFQTDDVKPGQTVCQGHEGAKSSNYKLSPVPSDPFNFTGEGSIFEALAPFWKDEWMLQVHTNGDGAMLNTLTAFDNLSAKVNGDYDKSVILIHATVGGEHNSANPVALQMAKALNGGLDLSVTHLAGHVTYWGAAMQNSLDGKGQVTNGTIADDNQGRVALLDAAALEQLKSIPVSFHSDAPVSPVNPLWYVQQMVDRKTWVYPTLNQASNFEMPAGPEGAQNVTPYEGLKAITTVPALQNGLSNHIGKLRKGMVADMVILSGNPIKEAGKPWGIAEITVHCSYVNGSIAHEGENCRP